MNIYNRVNKYVGVAVFSAALLSACASTPKTPSEVAALRAKIGALEADPQLASRAPVAMKDAELSVENAEKLPKDKGLLKHLVWVADHKIDIAAAQAQAVLLNDQHKSLLDARDQARLDSRTMEADRARTEANLAKNDAEAAREKAEELQRQIADLNAKATERGLVVTLGDLLFETNQSDLKPSAIATLNKLSAFLMEYPDRTVTIEGHTDSVGSDDYNLSLSQRRANAVQQFLITQGVLANRMTAVGKGENFPVASNNSSSGRQMNRRVEVIIANPSTK